MRVRARDRNGEHVAGGHVDFECVVAWIPLALPPTGYRIELAGVPWRVLAAGATYARLAVPFCSSSFCSLSLINQNIRLDRHRLLIGPTIGGQK